MIKKCPVLILGKVMQREDRQVAVARLVQKATVAPMVAPRTVTQAEASPSWVQKGQVRVGWAKEGRSGQVFEVWGAPRMES